MRLAVTLLSFLYFTFLSSSITAQNITHSDSTIFIKHIAITGNKVTKPQIITRELDISVGMELSAKDTSTIFDQNRNKVFNTGLFNFVFFEYGKDTLTIRVEERWYIWPIPILEIGDRNFNEWWTQRGRKLNRLEYGIRFRHENFRGRNERLKIKLQGGFTDKYELFYTIPYINKKQGTGLGLALSYSTNKAVAYRTSDHVLQFTESENANRQRFYTGLALSKRYNYFLFTQFDAYYHSNSVADSVVILNSEYFGNSKTNQQYIRLKARVRYDKRDIQFYPNKGYLATLELQQTGVGVFNDLNIFSVRAEGSHYQPLSDNWMVSNIVRMRVRFSDDIPYSHISALGFGETFVRGYELSVIDGENYALNRNSVRYKLFHFNTTNTYAPVEQFKKSPLSGYLRLHNDLGYARNTVNADQPLANRLIWGWGFGLDLVTYYDGVFRIEYSFDENMNGGLFFHMGSEF